MRVAFRRGVRRPLPILGPELITGLGLNTNLVIDSNAFRGAISGWTNTRTTVTDDATTGPNGLVEADKIIEDNDLNTTHFIQDNIAEGSFTDDVSVTYSIYLKQAERNWVTLFMQLKDSSAPGASFDLSAGVVGISTVENAGIEEAKDGFYRVWITNDITNGVANPFFQVVLAEADNDITYNGDGTSGIYAWGAQVEEDLVLSPLIVTEGATAIAKSQSDILTIDQIVKVVFTVSGRTAGTITPQVGFNAGDPVLANGLNIQYLQVSGNPDFSLVHSASFDGTTSLESVRKTSHIDP